MTLMQVARHIKPGRYIVAVSGGVDSMTLLDILRQQPGLELVVAHVNHGIRSDANLDEELVSQFCMSHNITFETKKLHLGKNASEESARNARYDFLRMCRNKYKANAIITAHHQDDLVETVFINLLRGTGWMGLAPFAEQQDVVRPLLEVSKSALYEYARYHHIPWREDSTNSDTKYLRNYVRGMLAAKNVQNGTAKYRSILQLIRKQTVLRRTIKNETDALLTSALLSSCTHPTTERYMWIMLPPAVAYELLQTLFRRELGYSLIRPQVNAALLFAKVARPHKIMPLNNDWQLRVTKRELIVEPRQSVVS